MPLTVAGVVAKRHTITIDFDGEPLKVTYRPYRVEERAGLIERAQNDGSGGDVTSTEHLANLLIAWDLQTDVDDPTPYPTTYEALSKLPAEFIGAVLKGISAAQQPGNT